MSPEQVNLQEKKHKLKENMKNSIILYGKNMFSFSMHSYAVNHLAKPLLHLSTPFEDPQNFLYSE